MLFINKNTNPVARIVTCMVGFGLGFFAVKANQLFSNWVMGFPVSAWKVYSLLVVLAIVAMVFVKPLLLEAALAFFAGVCAFGAFILMFLALLSSEFKPTVAELSKQLGLYIPNGATEIYAYTEGLQDHNFYARFEIPIKQSKELIAKNNLQKNNTTNPMQDKFINTFW